MVQQQSDTDVRSLGDLFTELAGETGTLVRQEISLAQAELTQTAFKTGKNVGNLAVGGAVGFVAVLAVTAAVILLLALFIPAWLSALIVGAVIAVAAYFMISSALSALRKTDPLLRNTIETLKEDAKWLKKEVT